MAIVQISKIQQRSGNLVDLPQLDEAEFGWASDAKRLFVGKTTPNENIEVLTSYSNISFSQLDGAVGNLNISAITADNGQVLTYDGTNWVNRGGNAGGVVNLGNVSNVKIGGGSISYVLSTDGTGNLSWTPKGAIVALINNITQANPGVVTTTADNYFTNGSLVTITEVSGMTQVNGMAYYAHALTANTFSLYSDHALTIPVDTTGFSLYTGNGRAISSITGSGSASTGGANTSIQFNNNNVLDGSADLTWNFATNVMTVNGNLTIGNISASVLVSASRFSSNIATGTAPLTVTSTTRVANLNVAYSNVSDYNVVTAQTTGTYYPVFVSGSSTANYALSANAGLSFNAATGSLSATLLGGTLSTAAQPNITSVGTLSALTVTGNVSAGNVSGTLLTGTLTTAAQPNVTSVGTLSALTVTANVTTGGVKTDNYYYANGTPISFSGTYGNANVAAYLPTYTGNITAANVTVSSYVIVSVGTGIVAAGTVQANATALTKSFNVVSTVTSGTGVVLPTAVSGMKIIVTNTSANTVAVYPASGAAINSAATNIAYSQPAGATVTFIAPTTTQWYTTSATYA